MLQQSKGLTFIEVLIALAILGIALTAIIKATSDNIKATAYLQEKMIASWVGLTTLHEAMLGLLIDSPQTTLHTVTLLHQQWFWKILKEKTPNPQIIKLTAQVFKQAESNTPLITLVSYQYHPLTEHNGK